MIKQQIRLERSPFHKQRDMTAPRGSKNLETQVSQDIYKDFINFATAYNVQHHVPKTSKGTVNKSAPLKHIINEFLNNNSLTYQSFNHLHIIMAFNKIDFQTPFDTDVQGAVIGYVEHPYKFTKHNPFRAIADKYNKSRVIYAFEDFNEHTFDLLNLASFDREVLFNISPSYYDDFDSVKKQLKEQEAYKHIDFDNAQICMFNPNNYFDIISNGVCRSKHSPYEHEGFVAIINPDDILKFERIIARINWSYIAGQFNIEFHVENIGLFHDELISQAYAQAQNDYWSISSGFIDRKKGLKINLQSSNNRIKELEKQLEDEKQRNIKIQKYIDECD